MDLIEAGKICRDAGFNWGRGSWWCNQRTGKICCYEIAIIPYYWRQLYPDLSKGATRGVILEWAREKSGIPDISISPTYAEGDLVPKNMWECTSLITLFFGLEPEFETEIECYARLCQWVKENSK